MPHEPDEFRPDDSPTDGAEDVTPPTGISWGIILLLLGVAVVLIFSFQNNYQVPLKFLWWEGGLSLAIVIWGTAGATLVLAQLTGMISRRRRRRLLSDKAELESLRREQRSDD